MKNEHTDFEIAGPSGAGPHASAIASSSSAMPTLDAPALDVGQPAVGERLGLQVHVAEASRPVEGQLGRGEQLGRIGDLAAHRRDGDPALLDARWLVGDQAARSPEPGPRRRQVAEDRGHRLAEARRRQRSLLDVTGVGERRGRRPTGGRRGRRRRSGAKASSAIARAPAPSTTPTASRRGRRRSGVGYRRRPGRDAAARPLRHATAGLRRRSQRARQGSAPGQAARRGDGARRAPPAGVGRLGAERRRRGRTAPR